MHPEPKSEVQDVVPDLDQKVTITRCSVNSVAACVKDAWCSLRSPHEPNRISSPKLAQFPEFVMCHNQWTHESSEARSIGPKKNRHVAGKVHCADCVGVVVNV